MAGTPETEFWRKFGETPKWSSASGVHACRMPTPTPADSTIADDDDDAMTCDDDG